MERAMASTTPMRRPGVLTRVWAYGRLGKVWMYYHWIPVLVAWALLPPELAGDGRMIGALLLFVLAVIAAASAGGALDDVKGKRDGIDDATYGSAEDLRTVRRKPLVTGDVSERGALWFGRISGAIGVGAAVAAFVVAPETTPESLVVFMTLTFLGTQYSYGLKLSYYGLGELLLGVCTGVTMAIPFLVVTGHVTGAATIQSILIGGYMAQVSMCSNSNDRDVDRVAGRRTPATLLSEHGNRIYVTVVMLLSWACAGGAIVAGLLPGWFALLLLPSWLAQAALLSAGVGRGLWLQARKLGWRAFDLGVAAMIVGNLIDVRL
jgi:1,4-dihydroxy-2-naphthoate polyprenyltransferase